MVKPLTEKDYFKSRLEDQIVWYDKKSVVFQKRFKRLRFCEIFFSVSIPVLTAIEAGKEVDYLLYVIGAFGGLIALFSGLQSLYKYQEKWIHYRITAENLKREKMFYRTSMGPYTESKVGNNAYPVLVERVEAVLANENSEWSKYMIDSKEEEGR